jgi:hypothetical protein
MIMAFPKIEQPLFEVNILSHNKPVIIRPFLVKEHKMLMMAVESKNINEMMRTIKQVVNNCIQGDIDVDELASIDLEILFVNLRARSLGEVVDLRYRCKNIVDGIECSRPFTLAVNLLEDVQVKDKDFNKKIELTSTHGIVMKLPTTKQIEEFLEGNENEVEKDFAMAAACIDYVYDPDGVHYAKEATKEELIDFIEGLNELQYAKLEAFFDSAPILFADKATKCVKCGFEHSIHLEGISDFFI